MRFRVATKARASRVRNYVLLTWLAAFGVCAAGQELKVKARFPDEPTGTMHFAEALTFTIGTARPLHLEGEEVWLPIPGPQFRLSPSRFLLLGWSSTGSGMQSLHVLSLGIQDEAVVLTRELLLTTDRPSSGLLVRPDSAGGIRIGLPDQPQEYVHNPEDWALSLGDPQTESFDLERMRALPFEAVAPEPDDFFYAPPFKLCPFPKRVAWIAVTPAGRFVIQ